MYYFNLFPSILQFNISEVGFAFSLEDGRMFNFLKVPTTREMILILSLTGAAQSS